MENQEKLSFRGLLRNYAGLPSSIYVLFVARIINRFGGFVHAFLTLFLSIYMNMSASQIGEYVMYAGAGGMLGSYFGGHIGDRFSRKMVYLISQGAAAVLFLPCAYLAYVGEYRYIPELLIISSFFSAVVRPVSTAMVTDIVDREDRKRAYSLLYLGINIGVAIGPVFGAFLLNNFLVWFFLGDAITTFIAVIMVGLFVKERRLTHEEMAKVDKEDTEAMEQGNLLMAFLKRPVLIVFILFAVLTSMMYAETGFALPLLINETFGDEGTVFNGWIMMFNAIVVLAFTTLMHYFTGKLKPIYNIAMAAIFYSVGLGMLSIVDSSLMFYASTLIWTLGEIQAVTNQNVYLMRHTPINYRSRFLAIISLITSFGYISSPWVSGFLLDSFGQDFLWKVVGLVGLVAAFGFIGIGVHETKKSMVK